MSLLSTLHLSSCLSHILSFLFHPSFPSFFASFWSSLHPLCLFSEVGVFPLVATSLSIWYISRPLSPFPVPLSLPRYLLSPCVSHRRCSSLSSGGRRDMAAAVSSSAQRGGLSSTGTGAMRAGGNSGTSPVGGVGGGSVNTPGTTNTAGLSALFGNLPSFRFFSAGEDGEEGDDHQQLQLLTECSRYVLQIYSRLTAFGLRLGVGLSLKPSTWMEYSK